MDRHSGERKIPGVYDVNMLGFNYRMNEIQAAIGMEQIDRLNGFLLTRKENYEALGRGLREIPEISLLETSHGGFQSSYYCLSIILNAPLAAKRFEVVTLLNESGVGTSVYYPRPVPHMSYYRDKYGYRDDSYPNASRISYQSIALPVGPHLNTEDMSYIVKALKTAIKKVK